MNFLPEDMEMDYLFLVSGSIEVLTDWILSDFSLPEQTV